MNSHWSFSFQTNDVNVWFGRIVYDRNLDRSGWKLYFDWPPRSNGDFPKHHHFPSHVFLLISPSSCSPPLPHHLLPFNPSDLLFSLIVKNKRPVWSHGRALTRAAGDIKVWWVVNVLGLVWVQELLMCFLNVAVKQVLREQWEAPGDLNYMVSIPESNEIST